MMRPGEYIKVEITADGHLNVASHCSGEMMMLTIADLLETLHEAIGESTDDIVAVAMDMLRDQHTNRKFTAVTQGIGGDRG